MKLEHCSRASCVQIIDALSGQVTSANNNALYWYNRCQELQEIIELFCMDAEQANGDSTSDEHLLHIAWLCIEELGSQLLHDGVPVDPEHPKRIAMNYATRIVADIANRLEKI